MALHLGLDPGGTGRKIAHLVAAADGDDRLFVAHLRDGAFRDPGVQLEAFPYLDAATRSAVDRRLRDALRSLLAALDVRPAARRDPLALARERFGAVLVSIDASAGLAVKGTVRHTETCVGDCVRTPDEPTFRARAARWLREGNLPPLRQRVYWQAMGFALYRYFTGASTAAALARAESRGIDADLRVEVDPRGGVQVLEAFPSEIYRETASSPALALAREVARRTLVNLPGAPLHPRTFALLEARLRGVARRAPGAWARTPGRRVGDCLDAFAAMMIGPWALDRGLRACATSVEAARAEGVIVLPPELPARGHARSPHAARKSPIPIVTVAKTRSAAPI